MERVQWQCFLRAAWPPSGPHWADYESSLNMAIETWWRQSGGAVSPVAKAYHLAAGWWIIVVDGMASQVSPTGRYRQVRRVLLGAPARPALLPPPGAKSRM